MDSRFKALADTLLGFSTKVKRGEAVLIDAMEVPEAFVLAMVRGVTARKARPFVNLRSARVQRELLLTGTQEQFEAQAAVDLEQMQKMDAYVAVRGSHNIFESSDVPPKQMKAYMEAYKPVLDYRVNNTRWVVLRWPHPAMAQQAMMSTEAFEDFFFRVCTADYARMKPGMAALKKLMEKTDRVHIKGPGTDLRFSIAGMPAIPCGGEYNIPDGEVFTAPVRESVEGVIQYNAPTVYQGVSFDHIRLEFEAGRIVKASASDSKRLNQILDTDEGARYIGEFAIGFNPHITRAMRDILFDEKIAGSFHFTPGQAYEVADNGNRSNVHWDMVCIQTKAAGGGEIYFDDKLIRKDGQFVAKSLEKLNPEYLTSAEG
ncbi:MAG: aminopeptidase [Opitutales bacterium]